MARTALEIYHDSERCWLPPGKSILVQGQFIPDGMIYVGDSIESAQGYRSVEPALINPKLTLVRRSPDHRGNLLPYWPSYAELAPESRAAYLDWLASGRGAGAPVGYVFLFFYGIERRILFDAAHSGIAKAEVPALLLEVERLLSLYSENSSFKGYASDFLVAAQCLYTELDPRFIPPPMKRSGWEIPLSSRVALGKIVSSGQPLPPVWALSWLLTHPESRLRTPVERCQREFRSLFRVLYQNAFGDGIRIKENKTRLRATYRPASAGLPQPISLNIGDLPDLAAVKGPHRQLQTIADEATTKLEQYSRWVGRTNDRHSLSALSLLPYEIADITRSAAGQNFREFLENSLQSGENAILSVQSLLKYWPELPPAPTKSDSENVAKLMERLGYGTEPDPRTERINLARQPTICVFRLDRQKHQQSQNLQGMMALLRLCVAVSAADGSISIQEEQKIAEHMNRSFHLNENDSRRLRAHLKWAIENPPSSADVKKRIAGLNTEQVNLAGQFLLGVAGADGQISPAEIKVLSRVYQLLGLDDRQIHSDLHQLSASPSGPVQIIPADRRAGFGIPRYEMDKGEALMLDPEQIKRVMAQTVIVRRALSEVFSGPEEEVPDPARPEAEPPTENETTIAGLDMPHSRMVQLLAERAVWVRSDLEEMATSLELFAAGAIERINAAAIDQTDGLLIECGDFCDVDGEILRRMLNGD